MSSLFNGGGGAAGASDFLSLTDTPGSYASAGSRPLRVNAATNAVEFASEMLILSGVGWEMRGDLQNRPQNDNEGSVGTSSNRYKLIRGVTIDAG